MLNKLHNITTFIFDVDGVLTNGFVMVTESGDQLRQFNIKDGYALQLAVKRGYKVCVISGGNSLGVEKRLRGLGVTHIYLGVHDKVAQLEVYLKENNAALETIVYVGDDIPDFPVMQKVGLAVCPADAAEEIKEIAHYISAKKGGEGVARDIIEKVLKIQNKWFDENPDARDASLSK